MKEFNELSQKARITSGLHVSIIGISECDSSVYQGGSYHLVQQLARGLSQVCIVNIGIRHEICRRREAESNEIQHREINASTTTSEL
jgi:hypothetical protein